jgi:hypothetical protein
MATSQIRSLAARAQALAVARYDGWDRTAS